MQARSRGRATTAALRTTAPATAPFACAKLAARGDTAPPAAPWRPPLPPTSFVIWVVFAALMRSRQQRLRTSSCSPE